MFLLKFGGEIVKVSKIKSEEFTSLHHDVLSQSTIDDGELIFPDKLWRSILLGAGEEKAVYCVCDHYNRVFAVEVIDEKHYLNGRFVGGQYFFNLRVPKISNVKLNTESLIGLSFTGLIKVREFVYGYEWGRFQYNVIKVGWFDNILTFILQSRLSNHFRKFYERYKDVHDRNVMFEIKDLKENGVLALMKDLDGKLKIVRVGLQAIDVR